MSTPDIWGPIIWTFIHSLIAKLRNEKKADELLMIIKQILSNLPCPSCAAHATAYFAKMSVGNMSKKKLKDVLYVFHNSINVKKKVVPFHYKDMSRYDSINLNIAFNQFRRAFQPSTGNMNMIMESFQRKMALQKITKWFMDNRSHFA